MVNNKNKQDNNSVSADSACKDAVWSFRMVTGVFLVFRLRDGSEYLFNASSRFMMKKWIMKIQASTGEQN